MEFNLAGFFKKFATDIPMKSAQAVLDLAKEGATVPFIARYRKEKTGNMDEVQVRKVIDTNAEFDEVLKRKTFIEKEITEQGNLTSEITKRISQAWELGELEEIYRPFKKRKKTKATLAREAGLEPLANWIWDLGHGTLKDEQTLEQKAKNFLNPKNKIQTYEEALKGAQDIIVEKLSNEPALRDSVFKNYFEAGKITVSSGKGYKPHSKYEMYQKFEEPVKSLLETKNSHRYLAMRRGWQEEELTLAVTGDDAKLQQDFERFSTTSPDSNPGLFLKTCAKSALNIYVVPSVTNEVHRLLKDKADQDSITVFAENVRKLLLASPYGPKCVLGVDPGLRTGCKVALIDKGGNFLSHTVLHVIGEGTEEKAKKLFTEVLKQIQIEAVAVGNGTAGRQTEVFLRKVLKDLGSSIPVVMVNESGASVYSASDVARKEFPDLDLTVRGAISIARRLQDPLSELVKVDPKSIGVGQYQHDVNQNNLKKSLEAVVESCVNGVGVDLNTSSAELMSYVSGIGPALAQGIVDYRKEKGLFGDRTDLLKVPRLSTKVFEQAAGFLRIQKGRIFLDSTGIHPERYPAVKDMAEELGVSMADLMGSGAQKLLKLREKWTKIIGEFTFQDILKELEKPGRDPRDPFKAFQFRDDLFEIKDLKPGIICPGIVTNVTNFGAFVDVGVHQDGLVHISEISHNFVKDPRSVLNPGDFVQVKVLKVDMEKNQVAFTMKLEDAPEHRYEAEKFQQQERAPREQRPRPAAGGRPQAAGRGSQSPRPRPQQQQDNRPRRPEQKPFNNPFAALLEIKQDKK